MIKSFPCFAPQGQKQGKTELFMVAGLREMQENQGLSENQIDKLEFVPIDSSFAAAGRNAFQIVFSGQF